MQRPPAALLRTRESHAASPKPLPQRNGRSYADGRDDFELVDQPPRAGQPEPQALAGRVTIAHRKLDVRDPWTIVVGNDLDTAPPLSLDATEQHRTAAGVADDVARNL